MGNVIKSFDTQKYVRQFVKASKDTAKEISFYQQSPLNYFSHSKQYTQGKQWIINLLPSPISLCLLPINPRHKVLRQKICFYSERWLTEKMERHQVLARSTPHTTGQGIRETRCRGKENCFIQKAADQQDGRLVPQNNHLIRVWMPGSSTDQGWREVRKQSKKAINLAKLS